MAMPTLIRPADRDGVELPHIDVDDLRARAAAFEVPSVDLSRLDPRRLDLANFDLSRLDLPADLPGPLGAGGRRKRSRRRILLGAAGLLAAAAVAAAVLPRIRDWLRRRDDAAPATDGVSDGPAAGPDPDPTGERSPAWTPVMAEPAANGTPSRSPWDPIAPTTPDPIDAAVADSEAPDRAEVPS